MTRVRLRLRSGVCLPRFRNAAGLLLVDISSGAMVTFFMASSALAAGSGMPWEAPLQRILE